MGSVCGSAARAVLFLLLVRTGWGRQRSREQRTCTGIGSPAAAQLSGLCPELCSDSSGSLQAAGSGPALVLIQHITHRMGFVYGCDIKIVLLHHCLR